MTERQEEQAALNAMYSLDAHERQILRAEMRTDPRLRDLAAAFEEAAVQIARLLPVEAPPDEVRALLLKAVRQRRREKAAPVWAPIRFLRGPWVGWAVAACLAAVMWIGRPARISLAHQVEVLSRSDSAARDEAAEATGKLARLEKELADARSTSDQLAKEIAAVNQVNVLDRVEVIHLRAMARKFDESAVIILWDGERREGRLRVERMPPVPANRDYQLWISDRTKPALVSVGVIRVDSRGAASLAFRSAEPMGGPAKFAISIEALGGVTKKSADGQVIFTGP